MFFGLCFGIFQSKIKNKKPFSARKTYKGGRLHIKWKFNLNGHILRRNHIFQATRRRKNQQFIYSKHFLLRNLEKQCFGKSNTYLMFSYVNASHTHTHCGLPRFGCLHSQYVVGFTFLGYMSENVGFYVWVLMKGKPSQSSCWRSYCFDIFNDVLFWYRNSKWKSTIRINFDWWNCKDVKTAKPVGIYRSICISLELYILFNSSSTILFPPAICFINLCWFLFIHYTYLSKGHSYIKRKTQKV